MDCTRQPENEKQSRTDETGEDSFSILHPSRCEEPLREAGVRRRFSGTLWPPRSGGRGFGETACTGPATGLRGDGFHLRVGLTYHKSLVRPVRTEPQPFEVRADGLGRRSSESLP